MSAMKLEPTDVFVVPGLGYAVPSISKPGYLAIVEGAHCTCDAGQKGARTCRHRKLVKAFCDERAARYARPVAPPNINALVGEP